MSPWGVGIIGAGPVTQAIHLPTLATLHDRFRVVHVMDVNATVAERVAARAGARSSADVRVLLDDPAVDVVAVCSPHRFHADQIEAVVAAGKRAILCEKPLAVSVEQAERIAEVSARSAVAVVVGAMHVHDPAFVAASQAWGDLPERTALVRVAVYLPGNDEMVDVSTDLAPSAAQPQPATDPAAAVRGGILGLATHNLPLVRRFVRTVDEVLSARFVNPFGYELTFRGGGTVAQLLSFMPGQWRPDWTLRAYGSESELHVRFPPSFVLAGSATATLATASARTSWSFPHNGYQAEWSHLADVVEGRDEPRVPVRTAVDDLLYALRLADGAEALMREPQ
jgi:predicted dehydrogenase